MFGFNKAKKNEPIFRVASSGLFKKPEMSPIEFGSELVNVAFQFGLDQYDHYASAVLSNAHESQQRLLLSSNPGNCQLLCVNLNVGAFYCYIRNALDVNESVLEHLRQGMKNSYKSVMPAFTDRVAYIQVETALEFAIVLERETREIEEDASSKLFFKYLSGFYFSGDDDVAQDLGVFASQLSGAGSRLMAVCQNHWRLSFHP